MSNDAELAIALRVEDPELASRLRVLLGSVDGLRIVEDGEAAGLILVSTVASAEETSLTSRELEVVGLLAEGLSNKEIARKLGIAVHTAKFHVGRVIEKLDASGRTDAVAHAARRGVIHL